MSSFIATKLDKLHALTAASTLQLYCNALLTESFLSAMRAAFALN
jgi:hypothetical protein